MINCNVLNVSQFSLYVQVSWQQGINWHSGTGVQCLSFAMYTTLLYCIHMLTLLAVGAKRDAIESGSGTRVAL